MAAPVGFGGGGGLRAAQEDLHLKIEFGKPELKGNGRRLVVIAVVLTAEGKPAKGWSVRFYKNTEPEDKLVETESSGRAKKEFSGLKSEKYTFKVAVVADGREIAEETDRFEIEETREFKLELGEVEQHGDKFTVPVSARLIDTASKRPISSADVTLSCDATLVSLKTDSNGRFWYDFPDLDVGSRRFEAAMPGSSVEPAVLILPLKDKRKINRVDTEPTEGEDGELKLVVPGTVTAYDRPIEGTNIQGYLEDKEYGATQITKSDGRFVLVFRDLKEGTQNFEIRIPGTKSVDSFTKEVKRTKPKQPATLTGKELHDGASCIIFFQVLTAEQKPVSKASIQVIDRGIKKATPLETDKHGVARYDFTFNAGEQKRFVSAQVLGSNVEWFRNICPSP